MQVVCERGGVVTLAVAAPPGAAALTHDVVVDV
jgi:hypothetical protein